MGITSRFLKKIFTVLAVFSMVAAGGGLNDLVPVAHAAPVTLFSDDFATGDFSNWDVVSGNWSVTTGANERAQVANTPGPNDRIRKNVSTATYNQITVQYDYKVQQALEANDHVYLEWSTDGSTWKLLRDFSALAAMGSFTTESYVNIAGAENQSGFRFRFRASSLEASDELRIDNVLVTGEPIPTTFTGNIVVINDNGGTATAGDWNLQLVQYVPGGPNIPLTNGVSTNLDPSGGIYEFQFTGGPAGPYVATLSGDCPDTLFSIPGGAAWNCTFTFNDMPTYAHVTVVKEIVNDNGGTIVDPSEFILHVSGTLDGAPKTYNIGGVGAPGITLNFDPNTSWTVTEDATPGYAMSKSADCDSAGTAGGSTLTCTVTNDDIQPTITVTKVLVNDNGGTAGSGDFKYFIDDVEVSLNVPVAVNAGAHTVKETEPDGITPPLTYTPTFYLNCSPMIGRGHIADIAVGIGENKTCAITNDDISPQLTVIKHVVNDNGGTRTASDFTMTVNGTNVSLSSFPGDETGTTVLLDANASYSVEETADPGYAMTKDLTCENPTGLAPADHVTCTITNDDIQPKLTVTKVVVNDNGGTKTVSEFPLFVDATGVTSGVENGFDAGSYVVSETGDPAYDAVIGGDCAADGSITLAAGDVKTCTITNDDKVTGVNVMVFVSNPSISPKVPGDFTITANGTNATPASFPGDPAGTLVTINPGSYVITMADDDLFRESSSTACAGSLMLGEVKTCAMSYEFVPQGNGGGGIFGGGGGGGGGGAVLGVSTTTEPEAPVTPPSTTKNNSASTSTEPKSGDQSGKVLGETTACEPYLGTHLALGSSNAEAVKKLQSFLNGELGLNLPVSGVFGQATFEAVKQFQLKYKSEILDPWVPFGLENGEPTGYVGKMTNWKIDSLRCGNPDLSKPQLP